jgi:hypothetical protein
MASIRDDHGAGGPVAPHRGFRVKAAMSAAMVAMLFALV